MVVSRFCVRFSDNLPLMTETLIPKKVLDSESLREEVPFKILDN